MKLELRIEPQQDGSLHSSLKRTLDLAASMPSLDRALEVLQAHTDSSRWLTGKGGSHVWLSMKHYDYQPIRVAIIVEVA